MDKWINASEWERSWWGNCVNTLGEELKQLVYAKYMKLEMVRTPKSPYNINLDGKSVLDIGGGPVSLLLKSINGGRMVVIDPQNIPYWTTLRYQELGIDYIPTQGEVLGELGIFDEVWLYNVLQHTEDPPKIAKNALKQGKTIRVFEWINTKINIGHPHSLTADGLDSWFNGTGQIKSLEGEGNCWGDCWFGIFKGDNYE